MRGTARARLLGDSLEVRSLAAAVRVLRASRRRRSACKGAHCRRSWQEG